MHFDPEVATRAYLATLSAAAHARSDAYFEGGYWLILWDFLLGLVVAYVLLRAGLSRRMRGWAERMTRWRWLQTAIYSVQYLVISTLMLLPWAAYEEYFREHQYGMSNQTLPLWLSDTAKGLLVNLIFGTVAIVLIYAVIRRAPKTWWLWGAMVSVAILSVLISVGPTYVEPVFNKFYPIADTPLKAQILSLARANGVPVTQVYEFDGSRQTTKLSAHVSGMFGTAQISMNDNLMKRGSPEEIQAVLGHEMGHYVLNHDSKSLLSFGLVIVIGFAWLPWAYGRIARRYGTRWGIGDAGDVAGLPLLMALFSCYLFVATPVTNTITRTEEAEADAFGLNAARQPDGFAQAALHLSEYRKLEPGKWEEIIFFDHPSGWHRIYRAMQWKAENIDTPDIAQYDAEHHPPGTP